MADSRTYSAKQMTKIRLKVARQNRTIFFLASALIALILTLTLRDPTFVPTQNAVLFLLFFAVGLWITEAIPPFAVGILIVGYLVFTMGRENGIDAQRYLQTWSDGVIWLFLGGFFLAEGLKKTRLDAELLKLAAPRFGRHQHHTLLGFMLITALISMFMSNTATTAMMLAAIAPIYQKMGKDAGIAKALIIGIPAAASIGGMGTIIGSAPNAIAVGALEGIGIRISFLDWMVVGTPVALLLTLAFWQVLVRKYIDKQALISLEFINEESAIIDESFEEEERIKKQIVLVVAAVTFVLWLCSSWLGIPVAAVSGIPIVTLTMLGIIDADDVRNLPWDTLMLVAGGLALGLAVQEQGLADYFVGKISHYSISIIGSVIAFAFITVVFSNFMSNTAATTIFIPVAVSLLSTSSVNPLILPLVIGLSASCALMLPVSTPPNAIAFSTGVLEQRDFYLGGLFVGLLGPVIIILWCLLAANYFIS